jgi:arabinofuranosyltransferase
LKYHTFSYIVYYIAIALLIGRIIECSWIEEDAYVSFRIVDNFIHGYGLRWNPNERVLATTHPLWMLLHIPLYALTDNIVFTTFILSAVFLIGTLYVVWHTFPDNPLRQAALFIIPVFASPTLNLYATSGQEPVFINFLFVCFGWVLIKKPNRYWLLLSLFTALSAWARLDTIIFYAPIWLYFIVTQYKHLRWREVIVGGLPLAGWLLFSLFYYGFLFPNTAPAKLATGLPLKSYVHSGLAYTLDFILADIWTATILLAGFVFFPIAWIRNRKQTDGAIAACLSFGCLLYCLYVIRIGGYQLGLRMSGLTAMAGIWLWLWRFPRKPDITYFVLACYAMLANFIIAPTADERFKFDFIATSNIRSLFGDPILLTGAEGVIYNTMFVINADLRFRPNFLPDQKTTYEVSWAIGRVNFSSGPNVMAIDPIGLSDPLISRLPSINRHWRWVGHNIRSIPKGYLEAFKSGDTSKMYPSLAQYYDKLFLITRGDLWDMERLKTLILFNLGKYEYLRKEYIKQAYWKETHDWDLEPGISR